MAVKSIDIIKSYLTEGKYPTASELVDVIDTFVSIGQNSGGSASGLATVAISGDYNDLTNKPTIPTVPTISTNIANDVTSDTKTTSPKAVKDFVEGKGYLTQHQDISGKADQTDLEALEDRVETLEQGGSGSGDTTQYSYLKLIDDLDTYTEAHVGEIVKFTGQTDDKYTRGWDYELIETQETVTIPSGVFVVTLSNAPDSKFNKKFYQTNDTIKYITPDTHQEYIHEGDGTLKIGDYVYNRTSCTTNSTLAVRSKIVDIYTNDFNEHICKLDNNKRFEINSNITALNTLIFESQDGLKIGLASNDVGNNLYSASGFVFFYSDSEYGRCTISCNVQEGEISYNKTVKSWQPTLMPSSKVDTDTELSSSSHNPVENAILYEELRVEETGSALSVNGTNYPIETIDALTLPDEQWNDNYDTWHDGLKVLPVLDPNKAYKIINVEREDNRPLSVIFQNSGSFILQFPELTMTSDDVANNYEAIYAPIVNDETDGGNGSYIPISTEIGKSDWISFTTTSSYHPFTSEYPYTLRENITYYGYEYGNPTYSVLSSATETTGSASVIKSLKAKVAELEAQISQISAQLQNITSN